MRYRSGSVPARTAKTLAIDIGGTGIKASVLDVRGRMLAPRLRVNTPVGQPPTEVITTVERLVAPLPRFDRIAVGFPGTVASGRILTAPTLGHREWLGFDLAQALADRFGRPARIANDVTLQGLAVIGGRGTELVITFGTGVGSALYVQGLTVPQFSLGHLPFRHGETYEQQLNKAALRRVGAKRWNKRLTRALQALPNLVHYDRLYLGGGNAKRIDAKLSPNTVKIPNEAGVRGGIALWRGEQPA